jgi:hypothetical protein
VTDKSEVAAWVPRLPIIQPVAIFQAGRIPAEKELALENVEVFNNSLRKPPVGTCRKIDASTLCSLLAKERQHFTMVRKMLHV